MKLHRAVVLGLSVVAMFALTGCLTSPVETHVERGNPRNARPGVAQADAAVQRPISDFLSSQGSTSLFFPPFPDYIGWANNNPQTRFALIDYTGKAAAYLAAHGGPNLRTQVDGTVSERPLEDGRAEVTVILHTTNAMSWVAPASDFAGPLLFGNRGSDLLADPSLRPALSNVNMRVVFTNDAPGAALPDLVNAFILGNATPGQQLVFLEFRSDGSGLLADGTPGRLQVTQTGIFVTPGHGATGDGFPAEHVELRAVGSGLLRF